MCRFIFKFWFMCLAVFIPLCLDAQFYEIRNFNSESGLPSSDVYGTIQDSKGYMWFATDMGASRYNGYEFKNFTTENGLPDNTVLGFFEDPKKRIWFRSLSGKMSYFLNDRIYTIPCNDSLEKKIQKSGDLVYSMAVDAGDTIWMGCRTKIVKIAPPWRTEDIHVKMLVPISEYVCLYDNKHMIYGGLSYEHCRIKVFKPDFSLLFEIKPQLDFQRIGTSHRFFCLRLNDGSFLCSVANHLYNFNQHGILHETTLNEVVISLYEDKQGKIMACCQQGIQMYADHSLAKAENIPELEGKTITGARVDRENTLWFSSEGQGVFCIPFRENRYYMVSNGLPPSRINALCYYNNRILTGHLNGHVSIVQGRSVTSTNFAESVNQYSNLLINCIHQVNDKILVGSNSGTYFLDLITGKPENYSELIVKKIAPIHDAFVWSLHPTYLGVLSTKNNFSIEKKIPFVRYADNLYLSKKRVLWICAIDGVWQYKNDSLHYMGDKHPLMKSRVVHMLEDEQGRMWMASRGQGVIVVDGDHYYQVKRENGLTDNMCRNMYLDENNVMWVGSPKGLNRIRFNADRKKFSYTVTTYTNSHGLLNNEVNFITKKGDELILAHNSGISIFNPSTLKNNDTPPPVYIVNAVIHNTEYKGHSMRVYFSQNYLKINYVGLSFKNPGTVEYKYKMEGLDTSWVYTKYTSAQFQTLYPGKYKFIVYAKNNDGYWSKTPAVLNITIVPLWWQRWIVRIPAFAVLVLVAAFFVRKRIRYVRRREREKTELEGKIAITELKALRAQMNPHFIFNSLASIESFIYEHEPKKAGRYLSDFSRLMRLILENSTYEYITLEKEVETLHHYLALQKLRLNDKLDYLIEIDEALDPSETLLPPMLTQPFIENSIEHAFRGSKQTGQLNVYFRLNRHQLEVEIKDNGIGIIRAEEQRKLNKKHKSMAMGITQERLNVLNKYKKQKLHFQVSDLSDAGSKQTGTQIIFTIPFEL